MVNSFAYFVFRTSGSLVLLFWDRLRQQQGIILSVLWIFLHDYYTLTTKFTLVSRIGYF